MGMRGWAWLCVVAIGCGGDDGSQQPGDGTATDSGGPGSASADGTADSGSDPTGDSDPTAAWFTEHGHWALENLGVAPTFDCE